MAGTQMAGTGAAGTRVARRRSCRAAALLLPGTDREALAAPAAAILDDLAATLGRHPRAEAMGAQAAEIVGLISAFHGCGSSVTSCKTSTRAESDSGRGTKAQRRPIVKEQGGLSVRFVVGGGSGPTYRGPHGHLAPSPDPRRVARPGDGCACGWLQTLFLGRIALCVRLRDVDRHRRAVHGAGGGVRGGPGPG